MSAPLIVTAATGEYEPPVSTQPCWACLGIGRRASAPQWLCNYCVGTGVLVLCDAAAAPTTQAEEPTPQDDDDD